MSDLIAISTVWGRWTTTLGLSRLLSLGATVKRRESRKLPAFIALLTPRSVIASGSPRLQEALVTAGVPSDRIVMDLSTTTTREQVLTVAHLVRFRNAGRLVLVASAIHMPRAIGAFRAAGLNPALRSPTWSIAGLAPLWPAHNALRLSRDSLYEYVALAYYREQGWLGSRVSTAMN